MGTDPVSRREAQPFHVRRAEASDAQQILACLHAAFAPFREQYSPEGFADTVLFEETVNARLREMSLYVAVADWGVVGTIGCKVEGEDGHLRGMAVIAEWQGTAVASELLHAAENELRSRGCRRVTLDTTQPLQRAIRFYVKQGYSPTGRVFDFFGMPLYEYAKQL
jgi:GNAT superfamily N-acetyltransferase